MDTAFSMKTATTFNLYEMDPIQELRMRRCFIYMVAVLFIRVQVPKMWFKIAPNVRDDPDSLEGGWKTGLKDCNSSVLILYHGLYTIGLLCTI